jgi:mRNA interferase MazF
VRRGEIWRYTGKTLRDERLVLVVSGQGVNDSTRSSVIGLDIVESDPLDVLGVPVPGHGWVLAWQPVRFFKRWLAGPVDEVDADTLEHVAVALSAALDL